MKQLERAAWVVVVIAVIAWGMTGREEHRPSPSAREEREERSRKPVLLQASGGERTARERPAREAMNRTGFRSRSMHVLRSADPLSRMTEFLKILSSSDADSFSEIEEALAEIKASGISLPAEEALMNFRAGQLKGAELLANRKGAPEDFAMMESLKNQYEGWIQADPHAAGDWLGMLPAGRYRDQMAVTYIAAIVKDNPVESLHLVSSLHPSQQAAAGRIAAERLTESASADEVSEIIRSLETNAGGEEEHRYLATLFHTLLSRSGQGEGELASSLVERHLDQPFVKASTLAQISEERAKIDPEGALQWAVSMEGQKDDLPAGAVVSAAIRGMTLEGLTDAKSWAATQREYESYWLDQIEKRRELLEDRQGDENVYDKDD